MKSIAPCLGRHIIYTNS